MLEVLDSRRGVCIGCVDVVLSSKRCSEDRRGWRNDGRRRLSRKRKGY